MSVIVHNNYLNTKTLEATASTQSLRPCPPWLGNFKFRIYGEVYGRSQGKLPLNLRLAAEHMEKLVPEAFFNAVFLQRYDSGQYVRRHRDPLNNVGCTLIGYFGNWTGATLQVDNKSYQPMAGDVVQLATTVNGKQGPYHQVSPVLSGTRWALILCSITD